MDKKGYDLLLKACRRVAQSEPSLQKNQCESADASASSIRQEMHGFLGEISKDRERVRSVALRTMEPLLSVFDVALLQICDLAHFAWMNRDQRSRVLWPQGNVPGVPHPNRVFYVLMSNLAQLFQAIRLLLLQGYEAQSRAMVRTFLEVADLTLAVVAYENVYQHYVTTYEDEDETRRHWYKHLKPEVIRKCVAALDHELGLSEITSIPADEVRAETYRWFSVFSHINFVAHIVAAHPQPLDNPNVVATAVLGQGGEMTRATFARVLLYVWLFFLNLDTLLWNKHHWSRFRGRRNRAWYRYRSRVFDNLFRDNYNQLQGIIEEG